MGTIGGVKNMHAPSQKLCVMFLYCVTDSCSNSVVRSGAWNTMSCQYNPAQSLLINGRGHELVRHFQFSRIDDVTVTQYTYFLVMNLFNDAHIAVFCS